MNNAIGWLFLHGHVANVALARALTTAPTTAANGGQRFPGSDTALAECAALPPTTELSRRAAAAWTPATSVLAGDDASPGRTHQPLSYLDHDRDDAAPGADGYRHGFGNRIASERAWRPRWQHGASDTGSARTLPVVPREPVRQCLSACTCG